MTPSQITIAAQNAVAISNSAKALYFVCKQYITHNSVMAQNWGAVPSGALDATTGTVLGTDALPADISNVIFAMTKIVSMWEGGGVDATNYGQNFEKLTNPLV